MATDPSAGRVAPAGHAPAVSSPERPAALPARLGQVLCLDDFEAAARRHLPRPVFAYVSGGVERNRSLRANAQAFDAWEFVTRVLIDTSRRSTETALLGSTWSAPVGIAPMGLCALSAYRGDLAITQAAARENVPMIMSGSSLIRLEEIVQANPKAWFQAYLPGTEAQIVALIERVKAAGYGTLVLTLDASIASNRENNIRAGFSTPLRPSLRLAWEGLTHPRWLFGTFLKTLARHGMPHFENNHAHRGVPILSKNVLRDFSDRGHLGWQHIRMIRAMWPGQLVIKGILDVRDARAAVETGADGLIISNHGGRQLDSTVSPLRVLPDIVQACPEVPVMIDSGFRRGTDVLKALALGAKFVFVGRPFNYAAAVAGQDGVRKAISLLREEVSRDMAMLGVTSVTDLSTDCLMPADPRTASSSC
ncbi:alpha-hydroxy acid oxidase [Ramlibacter rhizophilus]|uniref:Alpha-hydroxy-acid oxidizing protein n=1 Tax=Ramlibacter rhizophilus TaxID=1781167 RepID=A0A4Z0BKP1_9BURK|nr:alpha-hydroxy acid oxidase [Ramlibacter rhizophilus]TFY98837.1 alpha-hydroxy-acid oxidizing protein [Ramlibacter rhizophilus]